MTVTLGSAVGGVWPPTTFDVWSFRWTLAGKNWVGHLSLTGQDLALDSTVGLGETLASDWETGEQLAMEKCLPNSLLPLGLERRSGVRR